MGNIIGEGSAAAETNEALRFTRDWANDWLRQGLEHLSGDEVVHINFGKTWARQLSQADPQRYWVEGQSFAYAGQSALETAKRDARLRAERHRRRATHRPRIRRPTGV